MQADATVARLPSAVPNSEASQRADSALPRQRLDTLRTEIDTFR